MVMAFVSSLQKCFFLCFRDEEKYTMMEDHCSKGMTVMEDHCSKGMTDYMVHLMEEGEEGGKYGERK